MKEVLSTEWVIHIQKGQNYMIIRKDESDVEVVALFICFKFVFFPCVMFENIKLLWFCRIRTELVPPWSCPQAVSKPVWHIPLLCVQWKTPDDGQRNCPKHVEFYSKNKFEKLVHLVGCEQDQDGVPSWSCPQAVSKPVWDIPLLCVQWKTPDDGQRNCPKNVELYFIWLVLL